MTSDHRLYPPDKPPESKKENVIPDNQINGQSTTALSLGNLTKNQTTQQNQTENIESAEKTNSPDNLIKNAGPQSQATPIKSDHILKKNSVGLDESTKQESGATEDVNDTVLVTPEKPKESEPTKPLVTHGICWKCGHFPKPDKCKECGQSIIPKPDRCTGCGQIIPKTCNSCGQVIPCEWAWRERTGHSRSLDRNFGYGYYDKWSYDGASCRASTSRKLSRSSGDYDSDSCNSHCSCQSNDYPNKPYEKPCVIADSATRLNRSKWSKFKHYCSRAGRRSRVTITRNKYWRKLRRR